jgi:hypothetical protein
VLALLPFMAVAAFSGSPAVQTASAPPSGVANISGIWTGTSGWDQQGVHVISGVTVSLDQDDRTVAGTLAFTSPGYQGWTGTVSGTLAGPSPDTQFVGTIELRTPASSGRGECRGTAVFAGRSEATALSWDTSALTITHERGGAAGAAACRGALRGVVLTTARD